MTISMIANEAADRRTTPSLQRPRASIIIVNYNGGDLIIDCLRSLMNCRRPDCEYILVDNASCDGSVDRVTSMFSAVKVIRSAVNAGFGAGNNRGARMARGDYLVFLNPDTVVAAGWLTPLLAVFASDPQVGLATSKILLWDDPKQINTCGNDIHISGLTLCRGLGEAVSNYAQPSEVGAVSGAAFAIRRSLFEQLGGFDSVFFLYMEDTDLSWRAWLAGYRCVYVPESIVRHHYTLRFGARKVYYQERNRYLLLLKTLRWRTLLALLPALLLAEVVTWGFVLLRDRPRWRNKLAAYAWILANWRSVRDRRRATQALRRVSDAELVSRTTTDLNIEQTGRSPVTTAARKVFRPLFDISRRLALALLHR
jgi:GT2 family glycosyltransferase